MTVEVTSDNPVGEGCSINGGSQKHQAWIGLYRSGTSVRGEGQLLAGAEFPHTRLAGIETIGFIVAMIC